MHAKPYLVVICALALSACIKIGGDDEEEVAGTTTAEAAEALTKAISFVGGELLEGDLPDGTVDDVSLIPGDSETITPGSDALLSFDIDPVDASVTAALIQFEGSSSHFLIDDSAFDGSAGDGDAGTPAGGGGANLVYMVKKNACDDLCNTVYEIKVFQALKTADGVTEHKEGTVKLDCSDDGDKAKCGKDNESDAKVPTNAEAEALVSAYFDLQESICACSESSADGTSSSGDCNLPQAGKDCTVAAFSKHIESARKQVDCADKFIAEQTQCVEDAACDPTALKACPITASMSTATSGEPGAAGGSEAPVSSEPEDPVVAACGAWPDALQADLDACDGGGGSGSGTACDYTEAQRCDGVADCADGSDEDGCGELVFACSADGAEYVMQDKLCDGTADCSGEDPLDESDATCRTCDETAKYAVVARCDGTADCKDGTDETGCDFACGNDRTIGIKSVCDMTDDCGDGSDEATCGQKSEFACGDGTLVFVEVLCDGVDDCRATGADEAPCPASDGVAGGSAPGGTAGAAPQAGTGGTPEADAGAAN
jgi:Low-density lipoprotein receptor domain class A